MTGRTSIHRMAWLLAGTLTATGCFGPGNSTGDRAGQVNNGILLSPPDGHLIVGQSQTFTITTPQPGGGATWTVLPATAGTVDATGTFTASQTPGPCTIVVTWASDPRYTASATVNVLAHPKPSLLNPSLVLADGKTQTSGTLRNGVVMGEAEPAKNAASADGALKVRSGFDPPGTP